MYDKCFPWEFSINDYDTKMVDSTYVKIYKHGYRLFDNSALNSAKHLFKTINVFKL